MKLELFKINTTSQGEGGTQRGRTFIIPNSMVDVNYEIICAYLTNTRSIGTQSKLWKSKQGTEFRSFCYGCPYSHDDICEDDKRDGIDKFLFVIYPLLNLSYAFQ